LPPPQQHGPDKVTWLWTRLDSHASGRRSGDQFNIYVCDRFIVLAPTPDQQREIGQGISFLDQMTKKFIHEHLGYRLLVYSSGKEALSAEREVRAGNLADWPALLEPSEKTARAGLDARQRKAIPPGDGRTLMPRVVH
jgi:hypothetical protein